MIFALSLPASPRRRALPALLATLLLPVAAMADSIPTSMLDPSLQVAPYISSGLTQPIGIAFIGPGDLLIAEKGSGQIKRAINGVLQAQPVLDLPVNAAAERGLLSIALHPQFPALPFVYAFWTQSSTGADTTSLSAVPPLGNQVDRFIWNGSTLTRDPNFRTLHLRARQTDNLAVDGHPGTANPGENGNHNGGPIRFGPDGKLYVFAGDQGRRGWLQNLANGPFTTAPFVDDTFGGPQPDDAHLAGVILRLNDDGSTPTDNPFYGAGAALGGQVGANVQKIYSYGHRNGFGMAFDPVAGHLWETENADDAFSELNRIVPGMNGGWIQVAGPLSCMAQFKSIETTQFGRGLQQLRFPPTRLAYTANLARARMVMLPGAQYVDPELSWKYEVAPSGTGFVTGTALGAANDGSLWLGSARPFAAGGGTAGGLFRIRLTADRLHVDTSADPRLADRVVDNTTKVDTTESETLLVGTGFGTTTAIEQGPDGALYVVSLSDGIVHRISAKPAAAR